MTSIAPTAAATAPSPGPAPAAAASFAGGDFETFLKMLTTQIRNQDPLNPMEGSDFAVQLATFSGVEQQVRTNQLLEQLAGGQLGGLGQLADWIGKDVRTTAPVAFDGQPITLDIRPENGADKVELVALDRNGREVLRESIGLGAGEVDWAGRTAEGPLAHGIYSFKLVSHRGEEVLSTTAVGAFARVTGAELTAEGVRLSLPSGASALESEVTALRESR
ncbi:MULTISPECIES: flagellar hook capping FlgD N-terminal domain-containing protein [unclassified Paracoccus (in: a-proteobacteria)]|uniref:flagellar hook capping FlgD N-terminal domain-containing protein n=1 Tax=unclassified Paracoccus (in: a-proteobacteria) TaxID=2688777 RepID=UPI0016010954|nr:MULTISPECIES: flagellar hook capping FlgD N-terminal domain-containing protein [unclassified Paracoccus (in: a-proteobacteria)]MBB1491723.1 flagellar basal body rod modification protein [Paracoccus sp. MC1854]MBB1499670.1 flagellar basal body rod modification protein [Paracoccus sp. MC1862]QQO44852.1 flagellar basal body rod modification protein [Paracoccus sp. MC1862]